MNQESAAQLTDNPVIVAKGLRKRYGDLEAVRGIDFEIRKGECFGFLGPNGAGKSSTIRMLSCLSPVSDGQLEVLGMPAGVAERRIKERLGIVSQEDNVDPDLTLMENLLVYARYFRMASGEARQRAGELLRFMQLEHRQDAAVRELSGGMRRRLVIARSLMHAPEILVLDEPTTGLDPQARLLVWGALQALKRQGTTIVLTSHYMEEAERLADRLVVVDHGTVLERGSPRELVLRIVGREAVEIWPEDAADSERIAEAARPAVRLSDRHGDALVLFSDEPGRIGEELVRKQAVPARMMVRPANLEDVFLTLTGRDLRE
ncbi:MAG: ABC transporter ATP-binding protein [Thermaerobacter sp.]|nr:ABC transporter ATP-binding protein [Thermaerobacter sp.]